MSKTTSNKNSAPISYSQSNPLIAEMISSNHQRAHSNLSSEPPLSPEDQECAMIALQKIHSSLVHMLDATQNAFEHINHQFAESSESRLHYVQIISREINKIGTQITYTLSSLLHEQTHGWSTVVEDPEILKDYHIRVEQDLVTIHMPALPSRYSGNNDPYNQMLAACLSKCSQLPQWASWHAAYIHVYPYSYSGKTRDVDNYDYKKTNDILAFALRTSDSSTRFDMSMTSIFTDQYAPGTYIQITPGLSGASLIHGLLFTR